MFYRCAIENKKEFIFWNAGLKDANRDKQKDNRKIRFAIENHKYMLSKNEAKYIQSLYHKKTREAEGVFVVEGPKLIEEVLSSGYVVRKIFATDEWMKPQKS